MHIIRMQIRSNELRTRPIDMRIIFEFDNFNSLNRPIILISTATVDRSELKVILNWCQVWHIVSESNI